MGSALLGDAVLFLALVERGEVRTAKQSW